MLVLIIGVALLYTAFRKGAPTIQNNSVLALRVSGAMPDYVQEDPLRKLLGGPEDSLSNLLLQIKSKVR